MLVQRDFDLASWAYGLQDDDLEWFAIHGGAVEQEHGNDGLLILERYVAPDDLETP